MINFFKKILLISILMVAVGFIVNVAYRELYLESFYQSFISDIKWGNEERYISAYSDLYQLVNREDSIAMNLISEAYLYGYGIERDSIKANIWAERALCKCFETGYKEYNAYHKFLEKRDLPKAKLLLIEAAKKGNQNAILHLKDESYLEEKSLNILEEDKEYWKMFEYDKLYPYIDKF